MKNETRRDAPQRGDERHRRVGQAPGNVGGHHHLAAVEPVGQHPGEGPDDHRLQEAGEHDPRHGQAGQALATDLATREATATNPTQSPRDETSMAFHSLGELGPEQVLERCSAWVLRSAAISSATRGHRLGGRPLSSCGPGGPGRRAGLAGGRLRPRPVSLDADEPLPRALVLGTRALASSSGSSVRRSRPRRTGCTAWASPGRDHQAAARRARRRHRHLVHREVALGIPLARSRSCEPVLPLDEAALSALRTGHAVASAARADVGALRRPRAADERAEPPRPLLQAARTSGRPRRNRTAPRRVLSL